MSRGATPATAFLDAAGVAFDLLSYDYDPAGGRVGLQAADALGVAPDRLLKTLMVAVDGAPVRALIGSDRELSLKRLASAAGGRSAAMMAPAAAERWTGYRVGGISPFGQRRASPVFVDMAAAVGAFVLVNAGRRGLQLRMAPSDLVRALGATVAELAA